MVASLGLHATLLLFAMWGAPCRLGDTRIEVEVMPVHVDVLPTSPRPEPEAVTSAPGVSIGKRRAAFVPRRTVVRQAQPAHGIDETEAQAAEHVSDFVASPSPGSAESVLVARAAAVPESSAAAPGTAPLRPASPRTVAPAVGNGLLAIDPNDQRYQPTIPQPLRKPGVSFLSRLKFCVAADGAVDRVTVVTSSEPTLDNAILEKARLYRFHPYFDEGRPIPFCFYREYRLSVRE